MRLSKYEDGIPIVASDAERAVLFPTPRTNQRAHNLASGWIERWTGADWVGEWTADGTRAGRRVFDVTNPRFGAALDGTTDDAAAIVAAATAANTAGGGVVYIPEGHAYVNGSVNLSSMTSVWLEGDGYASRIRLGTAGGVVLTSSTRCVVTRLRFTSAETSSSMNGVVFAQGATAPAIVACAFEGGTHQINLNTCTDFRVERTMHKVPSVAAASCITAFSCTGGTIAFPHIVDTAAFVATALSPRLIYVQQSSYVNVVGGELRNVDMTTVESGGGMTFAGSSHCTLTGMVVNGLKGADGVLVEPVGGTRCSYITITGVDSSDNGTTAGAGSHDETGDGFDIYQADVVRISNCTAHNNGQQAVSDGPHPGFEIFECTNVSVANCWSGGNGDAGYLVIGSPRTTLLECWAWENDKAGVRAAAINGTESTRLRIIGGTYARNARANTGVTGEMEGIFMGNATTADISGATACYDDHGTQRQTYGIRLENTATADIADDVDVAGNLTGGIQDSVGSSRFTLRNSGAWDPGNIADGVSTSQTVTVTGATLGDYADVSFSVAVPAGAILAAEVTAGDTVTVTLFNGTGGALDLGTGTLRVTVRTA